MIKHIKKAQYNPDIEKRLISIVTRYPQGALERFYQTLDRQAIKAQRQMLEEARSDVKSK